MTSRPTLHRRFLRSRMKRCPSELPWKAQSWTNLSFGKAVREERSLAWLNLESIQLLSSLPKKFQRFSLIGSRLFLRERQPDPNFFYYQIGAYTSNKHKVWLLTESGRSFHRRMWGLSSCIYHLNAAPVRECIRKELCHRCPLLPSFRNTSPVESWKSGSAILLEFWHFYYHKGMQFERAFRV